MKRTRSPVKEKMEERSHYPSEGGDVTPVVRSTRDQKPVHYTLKIQSFSLLEDALALSDSGRYESPEFDAGGYKWKLALYPNGDEKRNGSDHISLYLVTVDKDIVSSTSDVYVKFTLLVYDHIKDKYLTIEDGKVRRFHAIKKEWGFPQLLSLNTFNDASNGFLVDDCCVFGVEIFVMKSDTGKGDVFSLIKKPWKNNYTWKIQKFSKPVQHCYESRIFTMEGYSWKMYLLCYPRAHCSTESKGQEAVSLILKLDNYKDLPPGVKVYVKFEVALKNQVGPSNYRTFSRWFNRDAPRWGYPDLIPLQKLMEPSEGYIANGVLTVEANFSVISTLKSFS